MSWINRAREWFSRFLQEQRRRDKAIRNELFKQSLRWRADNAVMYWSYGTAVQGKWIPNWSWVADRGILIAADINLGQPRELYKVAFPDGFLKILHVINHTPKSNGKHSHYWLCVPEEAKTPHEAVAMAFGVKPSLYREAVRT